jgi:hypothetical protein
MEERPESKAVNEPTQAPITPPLVSATLGHQSEIDGALVLAGRSDDEIRTHAVELLQARFTVLSDEPQAVCMGPGMDSEHVTIIVQGDFDVSQGLLGGRSIARDPWDWRVQYIRIQLSLRTGWIHALEPSVSGARFRSELNDPTLPMDDRPVPLPPPPVDDWLVVRHASLEGRGHAQACLGV